MNKYFLRSLFLSFMSHVVCLSLFCRLSKLFTHRFEHFLQNLFHSCALMHLKTPLEILEMSASENSAVQILQQNKKKTHPTGIEQWFQFLLVQPVLSIGVLTSPWPPTQPSDAARAAAIMSNWLCALWCMRFWDGAWRRTVSSQGTWVGLPHITQQGWWFQCFSLCLSDICPRAVWYYQNKELSLCRTWFTASQDLPSQDNFGRLWDSVWVSKNTFLQQRIIMLSIFLLHHSVLCYSTRIIRKARNITCSISSHLVGDTGALKAQSLSPSH